MINKIKILKIVFIALLSLSNLVAQTVNFTPAGQGTDYMRYNVSTSTAANSGGLTGGFTMTGTAFNDFNMYILQFSFDGTSWNTDVSAMVATTGGLVAGGNGGRFTSTDGNAQISVSHEVLAAVSTWPGNDGSIRLRINESSTTNYYPTAAGITWPIDLTRPSISTSSIVSNNSTNTGYATTNDVITLSITASENLMNTAPYIFNGNISGLDFITQSGADATQWSFASTVTTHAEATVTYDIAYYDENYNLGVSSIISTTDGTTVIVDRTTPSLDVSIASNNSNSTSLAKEGDQITLTISATETLNEAPTVTIMNEPNPTVTPPASSRDYTATHSPTDANGDEEGTVTFSISNVKDRAGNTIGSAIVSTNDGTSVTFDITAPVVQTITSSSNNTYSSARAKEGDVVTVSFSSQEKIQTPTVLIAGEAAVETNANGDQVTWTATKTMDAEDDDDDIVDISINYTDLAGNAGVAKTQDNLEANSAVDYDNTPPNEPGVTVSSSNTINASYAIENSIVSLDITSNEDLLDDTNGDEIPDGVSDVIIAGRSVNNSGVETLTRNNGQSFSAQVQLTGSETADVVTYSFTMTDLTGNTRDVTANTSSIFIDNDDPIISPVSIASNNATNTSYAKTDDVITLSFTSNEDLSNAVGHTPTATIGISDVTPNAVTGRTEFAATLATTNSMTEEAVGFVLNVTDVAGNTAVINQVTDGTSVTIDNTSPSVNYLRLSSSGAANTYAKAGEVVTLSFQANEELSSISNITIFGSAPDANPTNLGNNVYSAQYTLQGTEDNGAVPFTLNFLDQAGNTISSNLTSLVDDSDGGIMYDDVVPTLDRVTITSNNSNSATLAKVDDVITFSIRATELIKAPTIVIAGRTGAGAATLSDDTNTDGLQIYTATYTMKQDDPEGVVAFTVDFEDLASNAGTQVIALTAEDLDGGVTFDKTPPFFNQTIGGEVGSVTISSNNANGNTNLAKIGDQITLSFVATEVIKVGSNPTVVINNNNAVVGRVGDTDKIFTATYSMSAISDGNAEIDPVTFLISGYEDAAGNAGADVNATTDGSTIKYDPVIPTLSNVAMASSNGVNPAFAKADDIITITFNSNETLKFTDADGDGVVDADATEPSISILGSTAGVTISQPQANSWQAIKTVAASDDETEVPFSITYGDPAGNVASSPITAVQTGNAVTIDRTSPTLTKLDVKAINSTDSAYVRNGDVVIITVKTDEAIQAPTVTTSHGAASTVTNVDDGVNRKWEARHTAGPFETSGEMTFSVSVSDLADNGPVTSTSLINDLDGSGVTYDNTTPTIDNITFTSNNSVNNAYAKPGDIVTLTFDASERLRQNTIKIDIDVDGDDNFDESNAAGDTMIVQPTAGFSVEDDSEPWVANFTLPGSMDDANVTTIPYRVNFQDLFTVPGVAVQNSLDGDNITFDSTIPDVTVFTVSSNNLRGEEYLVKEGQDISINITADEVLASAPNNPTVSLDGVSVALTAVAGSDTDWEATYTVPDNSSISEGTIPVILNFKDNANNSGTPRQVATDLRTIKFDKTAPTLTSLSISSNNTYNSSMAKVGDVVTIAFTGSHSLDAVGVNVFGNLADQVSQGADDTQWTATYTLQDGDSEGAITFTVDYTDLAFNQGVQKTQSDVTDGTSITFDRSPTVVTGYTVALDSTSDTGSASDDQLTNDGTPTFNVSNLTSGDPDEVATNDWLILFVDGVRFDSVQVSSDNESVTIGEARDLPSSPNAYPITFKTRDQAGNLSDATAAVNITIDKDVPAAGEVLDLQAAFDTGISDVDDITNATEPVFTLSGLGPVGNHSINLYYQRTNNAVADTFLLTHTLAQQVSDEITIPNGLALSEDIYTFWYEVVDDAGNSSLNSGEKVVTVDLTPPSASATPDLLDDGTGDGVFEFDTGTSNTDNITNLATVQLTISGLSTDDNTVIVYDTKNTNDESDDEVMAEETIDATSMNITINNISTTTYGTKITDAAGNSSILSELLSITFDNTPTNVLGYDDPDGIGGTPGNYSDVYVGAEDEYPPVTIDLIGSSDTGADTTDHITKETLPSFRIKNLTVTDSVFLFATVAGNADNLVAKGVVDNSTEILRVTDGSAPLHLLTELTQNDYIIKLRVKDVAGNVSAFTQFQFNSDGTYTDDQFVLSVDTTPFTIASDPDLVVTDDTGISDSDNITSVRNPEFQFISLDASADSIELYVTNSSGATALTNSGFKTEGDFDHLLRVSSNLVAGDYNFKYRVIDIAGNESAYSNELAVTIDYTAPADPSNLDLIDADDNGPSNSDDLTNAVSMTLTGDGFVSGEYGFLYSYDGPGDADPSDDVLVQSVLLGDSDAGTASFTVANDATGAFYYYVIAQDLAGNASDIASAPSLLINVDLDPPTVDNIVISLDPNSDTGILGDNAGFNITPTFIVEESESGLTATDSVVLYYALGPSGQNPLNGLNGDPKRYSALSIDAISENLVGSGFDENGDGTLDEGAYFITARLRDFAGNLSDASAALIYRLDTTPPLYYDVGAQQSDPSQSFVATDLIATDDLGYSSTDNITKKQNPSFTMSNLHPFKNDKVVLSARKAFTTTKVDSGFVEELETDITLTVPWVDANGNGVVDADEGFALDDGTWTMTYTIEDSAGNITSDIPALTVEVDATAPSALGRPDLLTAFDTGESITDNLTNLNSISIDQTDTIPGLQWSLYRFEDNGDEVYNSNDDTIFPLDSNLFPGGQGDDGLDLDGDGVPDGAGSVTSNILVDQDPTYYFFSVQTDIAGNRSLESEVLTVGVDFVAPNCVITYDDPDGDGNPDNLVRFADGTLNAVFTFDDSIDDLGNPPSIIIDYPDPLGPSDPLLLTKVSNNDDSTWEYNIPLNDNGMDLLNGFLDISLTAADKYGNAVAGITGNSDMRIDNLPAVFSNIVPGSGSFSNADSIIAFSWNLDEPNEGTNIVSGEIEFFNFNSNQTFTAQLTNPTDLVEGDRAAGIIDNWGAASIPLSEGVYQVIFRSLDFAGNEGADTLTSFAYDLTNPNAEISFSRLYAEDGDTVVVTVVFDEDIYHNEENLPTFSADLPGFGVPLTGSLNLANPPETYDDVGLDSLVGSNDQGELNGQYDLGEPFNDINGNGVYDPTGDLFTWSYTFIPGDAGSGTGLNGALSNITIGNARDLAGNPIATIDLDADNDGIDDILTIDNIAETATFTYENLTNPSLTDGDPVNEGFTGIGGDTIIVTVTTNQQISATSPVPTIDFEYNTSNNEVQGDVVSGVNLATPSIDGLVWVFQVVLADSDYNDGIMNFSFNGKDLADNIVEVENFIDNAIFAVDNLPPTYYETGEVTIVGANPVQGWITGNTTEILTSVYIEDIEVDSTLIDGQVEIQFYNQTRGQSWVTVGENDLIVLNGDSINFSRTADDLYAVMDPNQFGPQGLQPGDLMEVRAKVIDKYANVTAFGNSPTILKYDPSGPAIGQITSGVFGVTADASTDTVFSSDQVNITWTPFEELNPNESGLKEYALSVLKRHPSTGPNPVPFMDTIITSTIDPLLPDTFYSQTLFLEHGTRYVAQIVGIDTAGNFSDTLSSDTLHRLNSPPVIATIPGANLNEDTPWTESVQISDLDLNVIQNDSHVYDIETSIDLSNYIHEGTARGGTYREVYLSYSASRQDDFYTGSEIEIGTAGDPQIRTILSYDGETRTAIVSDGDSDLNPTPSSGNSYSIIPSIPKIDSLSGLITWTPRQTNVGPVDVTVTVTDAYGLADTLDFILVVQAVNDPPESILGDSLSFVNWEEDASLTLNIGKYFFDVDNSLLQSDNFEWSVVILDTNELDEDFPAGYVIPGPGASNEFVAKLKRDYIGFDPNMNFTSQGLTANRIARINDLTEDHPISVQIFEAPDDDSDGESDSIMVTFSSDTNYYGADHSIIFYGRDYLDSTVTDSILATIAPRNDPPKIDSLPDYVMNENDTLWLKFGPYTSDVDDSSLTFKITALTYDDKMTIKPMGMNEDSLFISSSSEDSIQFIPSQLWSKDHIIQVVVFDDEASDTSSFVLDIERVLRPHFSVSVTQNNAFNKYFQIIVMDTVEKATFVSMDVANRRIDNFEELTDFTYIAHVYMESPGNYPIQVYANAVVGDTTILEYFSLAAGRTASRWAGQSFDGKFSVVGNPGAVTYDQSLLIVDSTLFDNSFHDRASYVLGNEDFEFNQPIEVRMAHERDDVAIYRRKNGAIWEELPSISKDGEIFTLSEKAGYFKLGPKTIIVPEQTSIHQNYPNPFNPTTTIMYDIGLLDGLKQRVSISVYNLLGQHVTTLVENKDQIGQFKIQWNGTDKFGQQMSSGVYFIQLSTKTGIVRNKKMMLLK